jgi:hypothetical protein
MRKHTKNINSIQFLTIVFFGISLFIGFAFSNNLNSMNTKDAATNPSSLLNQLLACPGGETESSYKCTVPIITSYMQNNDIEEFIRFAEAEYQTDSKFGPHCHSVGHSIGRAMYQKYGYIDSLNKCNPFCADGCTMGVMEAFFFKNQATHPTGDLIVEKAEDACKEFAKGNPVKHAACIHGTGHAIISFVQYETKEALDLCRRIQSKEKGSCYDAVFMEKFLPSNSHRKVSETKNLYEHCSFYESDSEQKHRCFGYLPYAWRDWGKAPSEILQLCSVDDVDKQGCGRGIVRLYMPKFVKSSDLTFFKLYEKASPELQSSMKEYAAIYIVEYLPSKALYFCSLLSTSNNECIVNVNNIANSMDVKIK